MELDFRWRGGIEQVLEMGLQFWVSSLVEHVEGMI